MYVAGAYLGWEVMQLWRWPASAGGEEIIPVIVRATAAEKIFIIRHSLGYVPLDL